MAENAKDDEDEQGLDADQQLPPLQTSPLKTPMAGPNTPVVYQDFPDFFGLSPSAPNEPEKKPHPDMEGN